MPIEIRELVIRAVVDQTATGAAPASADTDPDAEREAVIRACTERVLRLLGRSQER